MPFESNLSLVSKTELLSNSVGDAYDLLGELLKDNNRKCPFHGTGKVQKGKGCSPIAEFSAKIKLIYSGFPDFRLHCFLIYSAFTF